MPIPCYQNLFEQFSESMNSGVWDERIVQIVCEPVAAITTTANFVA